MIVLLPAGNPGPFTGPAGNNTWLIGGARPLLVDAGIGEDAHIDALRGALGGRALATVFVTHAHRDHAAGLPRIRAEFPAVRIILGAGGGTDAGAGGMWVDAGDSRVQIIATPGHTADHACLWDPDRRALFSGDLLVGGGSVMIAGSSGGSLRQYLASLARVRALNPARVYPGHGRVIDDPIALIDHYVAHRLEREAQVIAALDRGASTIGDLVRAIYPDLAGALTGAAADTLLAHLHKLADEGQAAEAGGVWSRIRG